MHLDSATGRRSVVCRTAVSALIAASAGAFASSARAQSRDIDTYVLFATQSLNFKGRDANATRGFIMGGNVGVNPVDPKDPPEPLLSMGGGGCCHTVVLSDGSQVVSDTARLDSDSNLYDLFVNRLVGGSPPIVRDAGPTGFTAPIIANLPTLPVFSPGTTVVTVPKNGSQTLTPGSYGNVTVQDDGILILQPGTYSLNWLHCGRRVTIQTYENTVVQVAEDMSFNNGGYIGVAGNVQWLVRSDNVQSNNSSVSFGRNTTFYGKVFAPNGSINLGHTTDLFGKFWAKEINSDFNVNINKPPGETTPVSTTTWSRVKRLYE